MCYSYIVYYGKSIIPPSVSGTNVRVFVRTWMKLPVEYFKHSMGGV